MAFRHFQGTPRPVAAAWKCPTCGVENTTPLEQGCPSCRAGADAAKATVKQIEQQEAGTALYGERTPFAHEVAPQWVREFFLTTVNPSYTTQRIAEIAFNAGAEWAQKQAAAPAGNAPLVGSGGGMGSSPAVAEGGCTVTLVTPDHVYLPQDPRTQATILAALAFYRDNQLAYGAVPGQLDAQETTALLQKLAPSTEDPS
jgi:hypothetical protein